MFCCGKMLSGKLFYMPLHHNLNLFGTPPSELPNWDNSQPHIVAIKKDEYYQ